MTEFLSMGGYAAYIWPAYGVAAIILIWIAVASRRSVAVNQKVLAELEPRVPRRADRAGKTGGTGEGQ
jgi:heme exporter protein D|tara:strand:+ start:151 stop:354 length:204 start_codon:yes stop_codon:yes gene_type:complete